MATKPAAARSKKRKTGKRAARMPTVPQWHSNVVPDLVDFRDRRYLPAVANAPKPELHPPPVGARPVLMQGNTMACTGFALATVIHLLMARRDARLAETVSPYMLYSMARRYDSIEGNHAANGSTLRGVLKGWFKHGAASLEQWPEFPEPKRKRNAPTDWWDDAVRRPLGAYYRVDHRSAVDMQVALNETGVLLASAIMHAGWMEGSNSKAASGKRYWEIPWRNASDEDGGHAFAIVGYTAEGFVVQNSWDTDWGTQGLAVLTYDDWLANGYDCWVAQLGVVTERHMAAAEGRALSGSIRTGGNELLDIHALSPYIVNTGNNGELSNSGDFHTSERDLDELVNVLMPAKRREWNLPAGQPLDVALYAHGGLVDEKAAGGTASEWIPMLLQQKIFPVFFMWESGLIETILDEICDWLKGRGEVPTGGLRQTLDRLWSDRIEGVGRVVGRGRWSEMKENAQLVTTNPAGGGALLADRLRALRGKVRLHLIGHSAGSILHAAMAQRLANDGHRIESLSLMAPAARIDLFKSNLAPLIRQGTIGRTLQCHLDDVVEDNEGGMRAALGYKRSLLYMIANGLEDHRDVPVLGMAKYFDRDIVPMNLPNFTVRIAPSSPATKATQHGGFDNDGATQRSVVAHVLGNAVP